MHTSDPEPAPVPHGHDAEGAWSSGVPWTDGDQRQGLAGPGPLACNKLMNRTRRTPMPVHITPHHLHLSPALRDFAHRKLAKVPRFSADALRMDLVLRRQGGSAGMGRFSASARVALPGRDLHAAASHADLYTAITKLVTQLVRHSRKRKTRLTNGRSPRRAWRRASEAVRENAATLPEYCRFVFQRKAPAGLAPSA